MKQGSSGSGPKIRVDRTEIQVSPLSSGPVREEFIIINEGKGRLFGSIRSDASWVTILDTKLDTTFIQRIALDIRTDKAPASGDSWVHILSTGGLARIKVKIARSPVPVSSLRMDEKFFQFCGITSDETITFSLTIRNMGPVFLSGTAIPLCDWIEIPVRGIWTRNVQVIPVKIIPSKAPKARHPVGRIHVRTNGGEETVEVSIHRSPGKGPVARLIPSSLRVTWSVRGIIEERLIIRNTGTGTLRGTIPSKYPWVFATPSIFSVEDFCVITIRIDTRLLPGTVPASVPLMVITNAGPYTLNLEISRAYQPPAKPRIHLPRTKIRSRMTVLDNHGTPLQVISSGKSGGEGEIWFIEGDDSRCVKIFHPHRCSQEMEDKISVMQKNPLKVPSGTGICWPSGMVISPRSSRFIGYLMKRLDNSFSPVHAWYDLPGRNLPECLHAAKKLASLVHTVHSAGYCIGDLRENNLFINPSGELILIDTDSFQITDPYSSRTWFCKVGTGEYLPPELINGSFEKQDIDRLFADRFALAVLIFRFLMQGAHPYQGRGPLIEDAPTTTDKIIRGLFAYEGKIPGLYPPEYAPPYNRIPDAVRRLFHETFVTGHQHPQARPEPGRWADILTEKKDQLVQVLVYREESTGVYSESAEEPVRDEFIDEDGLPLLIRDRVIRIQHGEIYKTDRSGYQLLTGYDSFDPLRSFPGNRQNLPPSVIVPVMMVYPEKNYKKNIRYLIPEINFSWYVHWHIAADRESRAGWKGSSFSFRHRVAACRNLLSAILSIHRADLIPFHVTARSVFVGPDSSVRIIAVPGEKRSPDDEPDPFVLENIRKLLYMMLMNGWSPETFSRINIGSLPGYVPSPAIIPYPMQHIFSSQPDIHGSIEEILLEWFSRSENALYSLIPCKRDPDHWFSIIPGSCPFCISGESPSFWLPAGSKQGILNSPVIFFLSAPMQTVLYLKQRSPSHRHTDIPVIFLPSELNVRILLSGRKICYLSGINPRQDILCLYNLVSPGEFAEFGDIMAYISKPKLKTNLPDRKLPCFSLYDELNWASDLDSMKGFLFPKLIRKKRERRLYVRKTISIMLFPGYFCKTSKFGLLKEKKAKRSKNGKRLSKTLSTLFEDIFG